VLKFKLKKYKDVINIDEGLALLVQIGGKAMQNGKRPSEWR
jgi:hypothetical protein